MVWLCVSACAWIFVLRLEVAVEGGGASKTDADYGCASDGENGEREQMAFL